MTLDHLWAGWRSAYVSSYAAPDDGTAPAPAAPGDAAGCVFCSILESDAPDAERHVVWTSGRVTALLNAYPYAPGHLLVMPDRHARALEDLDGEEAAELWRAVHAAAAAVTRAYAPDGLNLGVNLGRAAGAGIPAHLHVHVVPRWTGDTNFMTAVASARVLPEALGDSWAKLRVAWE